MDQTGCAALGTEAGAGSRFLLIDSAAQCLRDRVTLRGHERKPAAGRVGEHQRWAS
jgi:hypothetical protein